VATMLVDTWGASVESKTFFDRELLERLLPALVHNQDGKKKSIPQNWGISTEFRRFEAMSAATTALTQGTLPSESSISISYITATISQYGSFVRGSEILDEQGFDPIISENAAQLGEQAGNTIDLLTRAVLAASGVTSVQYESVLTSPSRGSVGSGQYLSTTALRKAVRTLAANNAVPFIDGGKRRFHAITHPYAMYDLSADSVLSAAMQYGYGSTLENTKPSLTEGQIPAEIDVVGVRIFQSTNAYIAASAGLSGADVIGTLVYGQYAYGVIDLETQDMMNPRTYYVPAKASHSNPLAQWWTQGWKTAHTAVVLDTKRILRIEHVSSMKNAV